MRVRKRDQTLEDVSFDKVVRRIKHFCDDLVVIDPHAIAQKICSRIYDEVDTCKLDELASEISSSLATVHPDYSTLAARIIISNHQKNTLASFSATMEVLATNAAPIVSQALIDVVRSHASRIDAEVRADRDFAFDYFGFKTLERSYLLKVGSKVVERPQYMWMRVALGIHAAAGAATSEADLATAFETYHLMSTRMYTHATPTLFNAGTPRAGLSSCFLMGVDDSIDGIYKNLGDGARISKYSGGIGLHVHNIRGNGSIIRGTNGQGSGIVPMLRVYNATFRYCNQGGKRNGSAAIYLEPWHTDVFDFIALRRNTGSEEERCRDLFLALWIPDLFMERVKSGGDWSLFCPDEARGLSDVHGDVFVALYERYEREGLARRVVKAQELWQEVVRSQIETGVPYMLYKDKCQRVNQSNLGIIRSSNLCVAPETEILTRDGYKAIGGLKDVAVDVWNGKEWSSVVVRQTGTDQSLLDVTFMNGKYIACTPYHKFYITDGDTGVEHEVRACELRAGMLTKVVCILENGVIASTVTAVATVVDAGRRDDTFCFDEPLAHRGVFNGILTGNCSEILLYSDPTEYGVCNLASIVLPSYVKMVDGAAVYDFDLLHSVAKKVTRSMERVIDVNYYSCPETLKSNMRHRPIGIGIQGLADVYILMRLPFESDAALALNRDIMETIYHATLEASMELAREREAALEVTDDVARMVGVASSAMLREAAGIRVPLTAEEAALTKWRGAYATFGGSPASRGVLQFDMWGATPSGRYDWAGLKSLIMTHGMRHSMLVALMPTASTSQIMGYTESFEAITSNFMVRRTLAGEFIIVNKYLVRDLMTLGLWNTTMKDRILAGNGSVQGIDEIPEDIRALYKTVWEIKQRVLIDQSAARGPYVCHTQSLNLYMEDPDLAKITNMHFYGWRQGLKTGMYYLRTRPRAKTMSFTLDPALLAKKAPEAEAACRRDDPEGCVMCSA